MDNYRRTTMSAEHESHSGETSPHDKALGIYYLYFAAELNAPMTQLLSARYHYKLALDEVWLARLNLCMSDLKAGNSSASMAYTRCPADVFEKSSALFAPYYSAVLKLTSAASIIANESIPSSKLPVWR